MHRMTEKIVSQKIFFRKIFFLLFTNFKFFPQKLSTGKTGFNKF